MASQNPNISKTNFARLGHFHQDIAPKIWQQILCLYVNSSDFANLCVRIKNPYFCNCSCKCKTIQCTCPTKAKKCKSCKSRFDEFSNKLSPDEVTKLNSVSSNQSYYGFDLTLLYKLFRNFETLRLFRGIQGVHNFERPNNDWSNARGPDGIDESSGADLERFRIKRNELFHKGSANISYQDMSDEFTFFKDIVRRLEQNYNLHQYNFIGEIENIQTCNMDEQKEIEYAEELERRERGLAQRLSSLEERVEELESTTSDRNIFIKPLKDVTCFEGESTSLECIVDGGKKPSKWYKGETVILSDNVRDESKDQTYKLSFLNVTRKDAGVYKVKIGEEICEVKLNVIERQPSLIKLRGYQSELAEAALKGENTIICAGTNAGKTYVAFHIIESHLLKNPKEGKVIFINRTNVLLGQQYRRACDTFTTLHNQGKIKLWRSDEDDSEDFANEINWHTMIFMTPKSLCNHLIDEAAVKVSISDFTLIVLDECHHTHDKNAYNEIMTFYRKAKYGDRVDKLPQILGLTASPGTNKAKDLTSAKGHLRSVMTNLDVRGLSVVKRNKEELLEYSSIPEKDIRRSSQRENDRIKSIVLDAINFVENKLNCRKVSNFVMDHMLKHEDLYIALSNPPIQKSEARYIQWISETKDKIEHVLNLDPAVPRLLHACLRHLELYTECLEINSLLEVEQVKDVIRQGYANESYACQSANTDEEKEIVDKMRDVFADMREISGGVEGNPDIKFVMEKVQNEYQRRGEESRILIFVKTRATAQLLSEMMPDYLRSTYLTGCHKTVEEGGRPADEQIEILEKFKNGEHLCVVATSVGSEGLDVPQCNVMIRYRFRVDEISSLQMRGRIRQEGGQEVLVGTSEEFETEERNIMRQYLMSQAVEEISSKGQADLARDIDLAEKQLFEKEEMERKMKFLKVSQKQDGLFQIDCKYCGVNITDGSQMRHINEKMYLVVDKEMLQRVDERPLPRKKQKKFDGCIKHAKAYGLACKHNWGTVLIYQECKFVALSQDYIKFFDRTDNSYMKCEKWSDLKYKIDPFSPDDLIEYNS